ncbi:conserved hypothetical protein [Paenibacillus curdlanolyticus YK9]|uniref:Nucleotidyltransferase-like domain-containing protein n=1 Tax=Paenibacillus curdlanolyticus YK9 TaxID=717606 RepID=E0I6Z7_9BACL|nr:nucleotidyltransferase-like protein [Paenibacillus curdlanolyticus]EFM11813.1 conserved hypothetical protein [Paenibacillus curdlanolyticus YK9]
MEHIKQHFVDCYQEETGLISLAAIENPFPYNPLIDGADMLLLIITEHAERSGRTEHLRIDGERVLVRTVDRELLRRWIYGGENRSIIQWLERGQLLIDRNDYLQNIRQTLLQFPELLREQKRFIEFASYIRTYLQAKQDLRDGNLLDAYSNVLAGLHLWAHIVLIEEGHHPELTVWRQIRRVHPGIYKLYEELTTSHETLEQRVQLVMLACEFSVMSKMKACCSLLLRTLSSREEPWSVMELQNHPTFIDLHVDLSLVLQKLVSRSYVREVAFMPESGDPEALELRYLAGVTVESGLADASDAIG